MVYIFPVLQKEICCDMMNITKYRMELDENRHSILVRESDTEYDGENFNDPLAVAEMLKSNYRLHA